MPPFKRLIRFIDDNGNEHYGDSNNAVDPQKLVGTEVLVVNGNINKGFTSSGDVATVREVWINHV